jgi:hypothetical protein
MNDESSYKLVEALQDVALLFVAENATQEEQSMAAPNVANPNTTYVTILTCSVCNTAPSFTKYEDNTFPASLSRRFCIFCPKCSNHPLRMFTLEGVIGYWNRVRH